MVIGVNCGHTVSGTVGGGAVGFLNESIETRAIGYKVMEYLKQAGHTVVDCTDDYASSVGDNLRQICSIANSIKLDLFISIHLNAGGGKGSEVFTITGKNDDSIGILSNKILKNFETLGFVNRGVKRGNHLYVVKNTNAPAALIEVCFVDTESDSKLYKNVGVEKIAKAICSAITGEKSVEIEEDLSMKQYEELKKMIEKITPMVYNYIDDNMPSWAVPTVKKLVDKGIIKGDENGLGLTYNDLRQLVWNDRAGLYD